MASAKEAVQFLVDLGLLDVLLPFVLVFTIIYALLQRTRVLGSDKGSPKRGLNATVAFVLGFSAVVGLQQLEIIQLISQISGVSLIIVLAILMIAGLVGIRTDSPVLRWTGILVAIIGLLIVLNRLGFLPERLSQLTEPAYGAPFIIIVVFFFVIYFIVQGKTEKETSQEEPEKEEKKRSERQRIPDTPDSLERLRDERELRRLSPEQIQQLQEGRQPTEEQLQQFRDANPDLFRPQ